MTAHVLLVNLDVVIPTLSAWISIGPHEWNSIKQKKYIVKRQVFISTKKRWIREFVIENVIQMGESKKWMPIPLNMTAIQKQRKSLLFVKTLYKRGNSFRICFQKYVDLCEVNTRAVLAQTVERETFNHKFFFQQIDPSFVLL